MTDQRAADVRRYVQELQSTGHLSDPAWREAFARVPRHFFLPGFFERLPDGKWQPVGPADARYWDQVYSDTTLATQLDGHVSPDPDAWPLSGQATSSSTQPSLMALMLDALHLQGTERVLEIGTGTGYNAALLCHRLGDDHVTTVEVDKTVSDLAARHLVNAGHLPTLIVGDGERGWPGGAPYDRVIATVSVPRIPPAWLAQVRDGGSIVASLWRDLGGGPLVRLEVARNTAQGFFLPSYAGFMPVRSAGIAAQRLGAAVKQTGQSRTATVASSVLHEPDAGLWIALQVPGVTGLGFTPEGGVEQLWLFADDGSWAMVEDATVRVEQYGPRRLWDDVEAAYDQWAGAGNPTRDRLGLTVTVAGAHRFWLDVPGNLQWEEQPVSSH
ncbi:ATP-grasp peptide maturase system methyltransferase [Symbioplanes lichenis]|uniref:ATP-grasp peptide maturase system methyltransferase n=1 Tax=Symbioplanes lichenis TaxID=1629072 RepID=UPI0027398F8F|nr:ATP-grasp peptide maturase system methyltransferase [Actinoplanes lichenis]